MTHGQMLAYLEAHGCRVPPAFIGMLSEMSDLTAEDEGERVRVCGVVWDGLRKIESRELLFRRDGSLEIRTRRIVSAPPRCACCGCEHPEGMYRGQFLCRACLERLTNE